MLPTLDSTSTVAYLFASWLIATLASSRVPIEGGDYSLGPVAVHRSRNSACGSGDPNTSRCLQLAVLHKGK
jgi:hypothetical protein